MSLVAGREIGCRAGEEEIGCRAGEEEIGCGTGLKTSDAGRGLKTSDDGVPVYHPGGTASRTVLGFTPPPAPPGYTLPLPPAATVVYTAYGGRQEGPGLSSSRSGWVAVLWPPRSP